MSELVKIIDLDLKGKTVLIREDYNVPVKDGKVIDDARIRASLPSLEAILEAGAKLIILSHLGRPEEGAFDERFSLAPVAKSLSGLLNREVPLIRDWIKGVNLDSHDLVLCENVRFLPGETTNDDELARQMAQLCQVYVNDAFATAHRAQASTHGVAKYVPVACAGPLLITELKALSAALRNPDKPMLAIVGGSKVSTKLTILESLLDKVDQLIVGGGIANTFLKAAGYNIGQSLHEPDLVEQAGKLISLAREQNKEIPLPIDVVCAKEFKENAEASRRLIKDVEEDDLIMDIGPQSADYLCGLISKAKTIVWNGPVGVFEFPQFGNGTKTIAEAIAKSNAYSIAGGGDTLSAITTFDVAAGISYISTGGGAFLEFLEGKKLPAVQILEESARAWAAMERAREF